MDPADVPVRVELYWIPLGAGGSGFVALNGRIYEWFKAKLERRRPCDLYHTALQLHLPEGRYVIETMWPSPDDDLSARGVVVEGPVFSRFLRRWRTFRYEVRLWPDGLLPDAEFAVGGPQSVTTDSNVASRIIALIGSVPAHVWGRDTTGSGEMWNSNSVISWVLASSGVTSEDITPPEGGRAPGWSAGLIAATTTAAGATAG